MVSSSRPRRNTHQIEMIYQDNANREYVYIVGLIYFIAIIAMYVQVWNATLRMTQPRKI